MGSFTNFENSSVLPRPQDLVEDRVEALRARVALISATSKVKVTTLNAKIKKYEISWRVIGVEGEFVA